MKVRRRLALGGLAAAGALAALSIGRASDHLDGPRAVADPQGDLTDVFAFTSPQSPAHVVLAMGLAPFSATSATFSSDVHYVFRVRRVSAPQPLTLDDAALDVTCDFDAGSTQRVTCTAPGGLTASSMVGDTTGGGDAQSAMRVFAGLRSDPAFFDRQGALATVAGGRASFTGQNAFAGANLLAIVVELASSAFAAPRDGGTALPPMLAVAAETVRRAP